MLLWVRRPPSCGRRSTRPRCSPRSPAPSASRCRTRAGHAPGQRLGRDALRPRSSKINRIFRLLPIMPTYPRRRPRQVVQRFLVVAVAAGHDHAVRRRGDPPGSVAQRRADVADDPPARGREPLALTSVSRSSSTQTSNPTSAASRPPLGRRARRRPAERDARRRRQVRDPLPRHRAAAGSRAGRGRVSLLPLRPVCETGARRVIARPPTR